MKHHRLTDADDELIRHLYEHGGLTIYEIAERLDSYPSLIYYRAKRAGVKFRPRHVWRGSIFPARDDELIRDYHENMPLPEMAAKYQLTPQGIICVLRRRGIPRNRASAASREAASLGGRKSAEKRWRTS